MATGVLLAWQRRHVKWLLRPAALLSYNLGYNSAISVFGDFRGTDRHAVMRNIAGALGFASSMKTAEMQINLEEKYVGRYPFHFHRRFHSNEKVNP